MLDFSNALEESGGEETSGLPRSAAIDALSKTERIRVAGELLGSFTEKIRRAQEDPTLTGDEGGDFIRENELELLEVMAEVLLDEARKRYAQE